MSLAVMSVVMLAGRGESTWIVANALKGAVPLRAIIVEEPVGRWHSMKRRAAKIGWWAVLGQLLFSVYARRLRQDAGGRAQKIRNEANLDSGRPQNIDIIEVGSP